MPKRKRHQPGNYKPKPEIGPNFTGPKPLTLFQADNGLWGVKDAVGNIVINAVYHRCGQTGYEVANNKVRLANKFEVLIVTPDDWDLLAFFSND